MIADSLSRQKLIPQLIHVYRKILEESPQNRQKVYIQFSENLLVQEDTDPHVILDFLQKEIPEELVKEEPIIEYLLGELHLKAQNKPKALGYFSKSLTNFLEDKKIAKIYDSFSKIIECSNSIKEKKQAHRQILTKLSGPELANT